MLQSDYVPPGARFDLNAIAASIRTHASNLTDDERRRLEPILWEDMMSEFDARFYSAYVRTLPIEFTEAFLDVERLWARDELRHYEGARLAYETVYGLSEAQRKTIADRTADFGPIAHLFDDEFAIACLGAYDELCTVRAYQANLSMYDRLGAPFGALMRAVAADEAWHYSRFLEVIVDQHAHRLGESEQVVGRIRATEGVGYGNTFVLDHDDPVFGEEIYDTAQRILLQQLERAAARPQLELAER